MEPLLEIARVEANARLSPTYCLLSLACPGIAAAIEPGQFVMIEADKGLDPLLRRPFSAHRVRTDATGAASGIDMLIKIVGRGTSLLADAPPGAALSLIGPLGKGFALGGPPRRFLVVGGGCGVAPIPFTAEKLIRSGHRVEIFYGAASEHDLVCLGNLGTLGVPVHVASEDGSMGHAGVVTEILRRTLDLPRRQPVEILACGPVGMLRAVKELAASCGVPCQISLETSMACGFGVCLGCAVKAAGAAEGERSYRLTCVDGPVFEAHRVEP